jgi:hypothetical protein
MEQESPFDLLGYLAARFPGFCFGGMAFEQGAFGLRFDIGLEHLDRAAIIFDQAFGSAFELVLVGEDWPWDSDPSRWFNLFSLPGLIRLLSSPRLSSCELKQLPEDDLFTITWAVLSPSNLARERLFQAIANQDHGSAPSVRGRVYILDPSAGLLLHMYDDRGLDVIATTASPLVVLREQFGDWVLKAKLPATEGFQKSGSR